MKLRNFKDSLLSAFNHHFPDVTVDLIEKRGIIVEARARITEKVFIEVYFNSLTDKKSFSLIKDSQRIFGYDNYKYWHIHPFEDATKHIPCEEPSIEAVVKETRQVINQL